MIERDEIREPGPPSPDVGEAELLVYGECDCGWRCGCPEGARWPKCPGCGEQVLPPRSTVHRDGEGVLHGPRRLAYVAVLMDEQEDTLPLIRKAENEPVEVPVYAVPFDQWSTELGPGRRWARHYTVEEIHAERMARERAFEGLTEA